MTEFEESPSYTAWANTHASDIHGEGWGSAHKWHHEWSSPSKTSYYKCALCYVNFGHSYNHTPDIFKAMKEDGVPKACAGKPVQPLRN